MKIGITGHQRLKDPTGWPWVQAEIDRILHRCSPPLIGVTSLAAGADQIFADCILQNGGTLHAVVPFDDYESRFLKECERDEYRRFVQISSSKEVLPPRDSDEEGYLEAGKKVADESDLLVAVWDGQPAVGVGGTGDIVDYAARGGKKIIQINPTNRRVTPLS